MLWYSIWEHDTLIGDEQEIAIKSCNRVMAIAPDCHPGSLGSNLCPGK